jgi:hypothetical protein
MVERRMLTREFVRTVTPPARGELWIADTKLKGFGLRLWATPSGVGKAFGLRISDKTGRKIRKTFDSRNARVRLTGRWKSADDYELGDSLEHARSWARDEIDIAKGRLTLEQDRQARRQRIARRMTRLTLEQAVNKMLAGMRVEGRSDAYVDRLDKLFAVHIPKRLCRSRLNKVSPEALARALAALAPHGGNFRILKSFIGQLYDRVGEFDGSLRSFSSKLSDHFWKEWRHANKLPFPEIQNLGKADYEMVFKKLEAEEDRWQQALCIRMFFVFGAPMSRLMAAQWWQIVGDRWYPCLPEEKVYWFESAENIDASAETLLDSIKRLGEETSSDNPYWFPSPTQSARPIASIQGLWRDTLDSLGSRYYPLGEFARFYRSPNNPTYAMYVVRRYGPLQRKFHKGAEVSKELELRARKLDNLGM